MRVLVALVSLLLASFLSLAQATPQSKAAPAALPAAAARVLVYELHGAITPASVDALRAALALAESSAQLALLIEMDTPGGLVDSMRSMVQMILASKSPVLVWVGPGGARAASAGVFLVAASDAAAMSPQAIIGAASPVNMDGKEIDATMKAKVVNDLGSLIRGLAARHGRNVQWYDDAVRSAVSITGQEAVIEGVVEQLAADREDFLLQLAARGGIPFRGERRDFDAHSIQFQVFDPGFRHQVLSWLLQPQVAYLLLLGGMAGLFFEFATPGAIFPGVFGGLCLLLGLYALSVLPTNVAGVLLILFALVLMVLEVYVTSFGMLGLAALAALFFGSTILFDPGQGLTLPLSLILSCVSAVALLLSGCLVLLLRAQRQKVHGGGAAMIGESALVRSWSAGQGRVFVRGELWKAVGPESLGVGSVVSITAVQGLVLRVLPAGPEAQSASGAVFHAVHGEDPR